MEPRRVVLEKLKKKRENLVGALIWDCLGYHLLDHGQLDYQCGLVT